MSDKSEQLTSVDRRLKAIEIRKNARCKQITAIGIGVTAVASLADYAIIRLGEIDDSNKYTFLLAYGVAGILGATGTYSWAASEFVDADNIEYPK